jgi:hypothetical protein
MKAVAVSQNCFRPDEICLNQSVEPPPVSRHGEDEQIDPKAEIARLTECAAVSENPSP